jgi:hypothetical protein
MKLSSDHMESNPENFEDKGIKILFILYFLIIKFLF